MLDLFFIVAIAWATVSTITAAWLATEIFKKNGFNTLFFRSAPERQMRVEWRGAKAEGRQPAMGNMGFRADRPFTMLVGIWITVPLLGIEWFHAYGAVQSDETHQVIIRTWLGKNPALFVYQTSIPAALITCYMGKGTVKWTPHVVHKPHWYQRWPLYLWG